MSSAFAPAGANLRHFRQIERPRRNSPRAYFVVCGGHSARTFFTMTIWFVRYSTEKPQRRKSATDGLSAAMSSYKNADAVFLLPPRTKAQAPPHRSPGGGKGRTRSRRRDIFPRQSDRRSPRRTRRKSSRGDSGNTVPPGARPSGPYQSGQRSSGKIHRAAVSAVIGHRRFVGKHFPPEPQLIGTGGDIASIILSFQKLLRYILHAACGWADLCGQTCFRICRTDAVETPCAVHGVIS